MAIKDFILAGLVLSAQLSEAAVIGPNKHWLHQRSLSNTTATGDPDTSTDPPTSSSPLSSSSDSATTGSEPASSSEIAESSSSIADSTSAYKPKPVVPTSSPCAGDGNTLCDDHDDENDTPEGSDKPEVEEPDGGENPNHDEDSDDEDHETPGDDDEDHGDSGDDEETSDSSTHTSPVTNEDGEVCTPLAEGEVVTVYSLIYTETVTWTGDPSDYVAPYPTMELPTYCEPTITSLTSSTSTSTPKLTSVSGPDDGWNTYCTERKNGTTSCTSEPIFNPSFILTTRPYERTSPLIGPPSGAPVTSTFFITSKNPSVVFPPDPTPDYGQDDDDDLPHNPGDGNFPAETRHQGNPRPAQSAVNRDPQKVTITADPTQVIIGDYTLSNLKPGATTRVTVGGNEYEVNPSQIVQAGGKTINRPGAGQALVVADPINTAIDGVAINVKGSQVVIGGYTYTIGSTPSTEVVQGHTVVISPTGIEFRGIDGGVSFEASPPEQTGIIVAGGEMMTAIGNSVIVIHEKTITYGPGISPRTETVDDDTIVIDEHGAIVHGTTIGGDTLAGDETRYDVVGGATLTRVGASKIVIRDVTYTVGPGTGTTTTFVGGEDVTIAPDGVTVATLTVPYPFGATVVTAIPAPKTTNPSPQETAEEEDEEDGAGALRPAWAGVCIAIGAWLFL